MKQRFPKKTYGQRWQIESVFSMFTRTMGAALRARSYHSQKREIRLPDPSLSDVYGCELVGPQMGVLVAMTLPWLELFVGICLVGGAFIGGALLAGIAMGAMFTFVLASALYRRLDISCGCFSSAAGKISYLTLIRAIVIMLLSAAAYAATILLAPQQYLPPAPTPQSPPEAAPAPGPEGLLAQE